MPTTDSKIVAVKNWVNEVVIELNFCPFAKKEFVNSRIRYEDCPTSNIEEAIAKLIDEIELLQAETSIATSLLIFANGFDEFEDYLDLLDVANSFVEEYWAGVFQIASFHPNYQFEGLQADDAANFTNRAPYPVLHLLREDDLSKAVSSYSHPERIPEDNIEKARALGNSYFENILSKLLAK